MKLPVDLAAIKADPEGFVEALFGHGGIASRVLPRHEYNPAQIGYATNLVKAALRGRDAGIVGRVTLIEAETGTGKTVAYLTVGLVFALLTGKRFLVSTYTRALMHQVVSQEAGLALAIAREALGFEGTSYAGREGISVAPRRSRAAFVSPSRARHKAAILDREGKPDLASALRDYADLAQAALDRAAREGAAALVASLDGTIEAFDALDPDRAERLREVPQNSYKLTAASPPQEQVIWAAYDAAARTAVGLVVTHAALLIDMSLFGSLTDARDHGYALAVIDEAHALPRAATSAFSDKISLKAMAEEAGDLVIALHNRDGLAFPPDEQDRLLTVAREYEDAVQAVLAGAQEQADATNVERRAVTIATDTTWYGTLPRLRDALGDIVAVLTRAGRGEGASAEAALGHAKALAHNDRPLQMLLDSIAWRAKNKKTGLYVPQLSLTPVRRDPCLQTVPVQAQRIVSRLWESGVASRGDNRGPMADAVVFTSATLVSKTVGAEGYDAFRKAAWAYGVDDKTTRVNQDLCASFEPEIFGRPKFVFADPKAPYMTDRVSDDPSVTEAGADYLALAIQEAARRPNPRTGACRQVVLTKSYEDVAVIAESLPDSFADKVVARHRGQSLQSALRAWRERPDAILITPGAHEGMNEPGMVEHLHIYRLPYDPPKEIDGKRDHFLNAWAEMMTTLRQAIGRGVRQPTDAPTYWITDVRVAPPKAVLQRVEGFKDVAGNQSYLAAFPTRWARLMNQGEIFPCPAELRARRVNVRPRDEENAA